MDKRKLCGLLAWASVASADTGVTTPRPLPTAATGGATPFTLILGVPAIAVENIRSCTEIQPAVFAVGDGWEGVHPEREPLLLVHGLDGSPSEFAAVIERFKNSPFQIYVTCWDSMGQRTSAAGDGLAAVLRQLERQVVGPRRDLTIVAHSLGGIVTRRALVELAGGRGLERWGHVRVVAVDTPWHGYGGPADRNPVAKVVRAFLPVGLVDMRAESLMFAGDRRRAGLLDVELPAEQVSIEVVFAEHGKDVLDFTEGELRPLAGFLVDHYRTGKRSPLAGSARQRNFWKALRSSSRGADLDDELTQLAQRGRLDEAHLRTALAERFPRFPGDHQSVIGEQRCYGLLDHLSETLSPRSAALVAKR